MRAGVVGLAIAAVALTTGCVAAPEVSALGGSSIAPSSNISTCPTTFSSGSKLGYNTTTGLNLVDPATTEVLVCRYVSASATPDVWTLDAQGALSGQRATALVVAVNGAPDANLQMRGCSISTRDEVWFFATGTAVTAQFWVQLDGCAVASDGIRTVTWSNGDPLPN